MVNLPNVLTPFYLTADKRHLLETIRLSLTVRKVSKYAVCSGPYSVRMQENTDQKKLSVWTRFS